MRGIRPRSSKPLRGAQHLLDMARNLDLAPDAADLAFLVDEEGGAVDAHVFAPVQALFDPRPVLLADLAVLVGRDRDLARAVLRIGGELVERRDLVERDADDGGAEYVFRLAVPTGIYGGTLEVFRNMIGQYTLGLGKPNYSPPVKKVS